MRSELIQLGFDKIMQTRSYTVVVLTSGEKRFGIYTDPEIGRTLQLYLTDAEKARPLTHDLIRMIFQGFDLRIKQVIINDVKETVYFARLFLEQDLGNIRHVVEIDARPSDCLTLAIMLSIPVFCTPEVLEKTIALED